MSLILMTPKGSQHGLRTPNEASFLSKSQTYEFVQIKFGVFGVLLANLTSLILVLWVSCSCFPLINHYFYKKISLNAKLYIPSTLNIDHILWHSQLIVCAENVKSWFKSWVFPFTFQAYILPHTLNCMCVSLFRFHIWILEQF